MKTKLELAEILDKNKELEIKRNNALGMAEELIINIQHDIPSHLKLKPILEMVSDYARMLDSKIVKHGPSMYNYGCRCEVCKSYKREWAREYEKIKKARKQRRGL